MKEWLVEIEQCATDVKWIAPHERRREIVTVKLDGRVKSKVTAVKAVRNIPQHYADQIGVAWPMRVCRVIGMKEVVANGT